MRGKNPRDLTWLTVAAGMERRRGVVGGTVWLSNAASFRWQLLGLKNVCHLTRTPHILPRPPVHPSSCLCFSASFLFCFTLYENFFADLAEARAKIYTPHTHTQTHRCATAKPSQAACHMRSAWLGLPCALFGWADPWIINNSRQTEQSRAAVEYKKWLKRSQRTLFKY